MKDLLGDQLYEPGRNARDEGMKQVEKNSDDWMQEAFSIISQYGLGWIGTGEDIKFNITRLIGPPHHVNVWGALIMKARRRGLLQRTGLWVKAKGAASHARNIQEYRRV